jgi:predicted acyl esterase
MRWTGRIFCIAAAIILRAGPVVADTPSENAPPLFSYQEVMVPMRDGVKLQTVIFLPAGVTAPLPILLTRTP